MIEFLIFTQFLNIIPRTFFDWFWFDNRKLNLTCFVRKFKHKNSILVLTATLKKRKKHSSTLKNLIHCCAFLFKSNQKTEKLVLIAQHISFCFLWSEATQKTRESEADTKNDVFTRRRWLYVKISKKKNFRFFCHIVRQTLSSVSNVRLYSRNRTEL